VRLFYTANILTMCKCGECCECRSSLPKSLSIEIANSKNDMPLVTDVPAVAKPIFRHGHHGRLNWLDAATSFLKRIYLNRVIPSLPAAEKMPQRLRSRAEFHRKFRAGAHCGPLRVAGAGNKQCRVDEYEAVRLYARAMLPAFLASARQRQLF
jgi:hypothetical protein